MEATMKKVIVTIAREYASKGDIIGKELASALKIPFYDKDLISLAAKESGLAAEFIKAAEQQRTSSLLYSLYMNTQVLPLTEQIFLVQSTIIKELAAKGSCVILGRCGDYILREDPDLVPIFLYAPLAYRTEVASQEYEECIGKKPEFISNFIVKQDKNRASYYSFYTQQKWGFAHNYKLAVDTSIGVESVVSILKTYLETMSQ
jgi:hypothetical protein